MLRKRLCSLTVAVLILVAMLNVTVPVSASPGTLHVGTGYPYSNIQEAIDAAVDGDTIIVHPGTYGPIFVYKRLTIKGTNAIIQGSNLIYGYDVGVYINVGRVVLCGFTVNTIGYEVLGIYAEIGDNIRVTNNKVYADGSDWCYGIYAIGAGDYISNNKVQVEGDYFSNGIYVSGDNARITNNKVETATTATGESYSYGIEVYGNSAKITKNDISAEAGTSIQSDSVGIYIYGNEACISNNKIDTYGYDSWAIAIYGNSARILNNNAHADAVEYSAGIYLSGGNAKISRNNFNCKVGIDVEHGSQSTIQRNTINAEAVGIWLYDTSKNRVETNTIAGLTDTSCYDLTNVYGILVEESNSTLLHDNTITGSNVVDSVGIGLVSSSSGNTLVFNKIDNVDTEILDEGTGNILLANWR